MREDIWVDELNFKSYQNNEIDFIDDSGKSCCIHSLTDYTKQVKKQVCDEIREKATIKYYEEYDGFDRKIGKTYIIRDYDLNQIQGENND